MHCQILQEKVLLVRPVVHIHHRTLYLVLLSADIVIAPSQMFLLLTCWQTRFGLELSTSSLLLDTLCQALLDNEKNWFLLRTP